MMENFKEELGIKAKPTVFHLFIFEKLIQKLEFNSKKMERNLARFVLSKHTVPKQHHHTFLKEMEECGLIRCIDKSNIEVVGQSQGLVRPLETIAKDMLSKGMLRKEIAAQLGVCHQRTGQLLNK